MTEIGDPNPDLSGPRNYPSRLRVLAGGLSTRLPKPLKRQRVILRRRFVAVAIDREEECKQERKNECHAISSQSSHRDGDRIPSGSFGLVAAGGASTAGDAKDDRAGGEWGPRAFVRRCGCARPAAVPRGCRVVGRRCDRGDCCSMTNRVFIIPSRASMCTL